MRKIVFTLLFILAVQPAQARAAGTLRVVCIGDSITQGCGHLGKDTDPPTYGWRYAFWKDCVAAGYPVEMVGSIDTGANGTPVYANFNGQKFNNRHESRWGWNTEQIRDQLKQTSLHWTADLALIHLGDNPEPQTEAEKSSDPEGIDRTVKAMRDLINILRANNPQIAIVLRAPDGGSARNNGLDVAYKKLAAQLGSAASPILTADLPADWVADPNQPDTDTCDGCHPNSKGDKKIADGYFKAAQKGLRVFSSSRVHAAQSIENDRYAIRVEAAKGGFNIATRPGNKVFLTDGKLSGPSGSAKAIELTDQTFGNGKGIEISYPNGNWETFALGYFEDARFGLEAYADAIAKVYSIMLHPARPGYCTWYMEKNGGCSNEKFLAEIAAYAAKNLKPFGFDFVQIDDGWQQGDGGNGPSKVFSAYKPQGAYPGGMKATADTVKRLGLTPGIWFMPFAGNYLDPFFKDHQDWFAKNPEGKPYDTVWGALAWI